MKRLGLNNGKNKKIIERLKYGSGLVVENVSEEGIIEEIYVNESGENYFINAWWSVPAPISYKVPGGGYVIQNIFVTVYYNKEQKRVEKAAIIPNATFVPIKGSNIMGLLISPNGDRMTYSVGESINNNSPIEFAKEAEDGEEFAAVTFGWNPEDFASEFVEPEKLAEMAKNNEKLDSAYSSVGRYFYFAVDRYGNPTGMLYDSTMDKYLPVGDLGTFEKEFIARAIRQAKEDKADKKGKISYVRRLADSAKRKYLVPKK